MPNRILIVRTDRIGDVLLTTPVSRRLRETFPGAHIAWLVRPYTAPLLEQNPDVSKWYSLFFNRRVWQHRSEGKKHEADYNLDLLEPLGVPFQRTPTRLVLTAEEKSRARSFLESNRISFRKPVVCLHPGSGGSSARWPLVHFMELGDRLQEAGYDVIVTGGPGEDYQNIMIDHMRRIPVFVAAGSISVRELGAILSSTNLMITNSTGPLHIAVALGVPTVSVYSPIPTCNPRRWGPYPSYAEGSPEHPVFMPPLTGVSAGDMSVVSVEEVLNVCRKKLDSQQGVKVAL